jgi:CelD/BcsL family acetyltransferase involved in cellulose biosynthesis
MPRAGASTIKIDSVVTGKDMGNLSIEEVNDIEGFRALKETWNNLLSQCPDNNIFLTWEWLFHWWRHYGGDKKLRILLIRESDKIIGIAPFMENTYREGFASFNVIENICSENCDYSSIILTEQKQESVTRLVDYMARIAREGDNIIRIYQVPENSTFLTILREQYPSLSKSLFLNEKVITSCPYIELPKTWEEYLRSLRKKRRGNLRRAMQSLQQDHKVEFKKYTAGDDLRKQLQVLFKLHQKRWQGENIVSKFTTAEAREFYTDVSKAFSEKNWLSFSSLDVDGKTASILWGFTYLNTWWDMTPAFDPDYAQYSVGNLHMMKIIEESIQNGLEKIDFLKGQASYKFHWTSSERDNYRITIARKGFGGRYRVWLFEVLKKYSNSRKRSFRENIELLINKIRR